MKTAYLGSCYTDESDLVQHQRYVEVTKCAVWLVKKKIAIYSPITQGRILAAFGKLPHDYSFWLKHDRAMIAKLDEFIVFIQKGWKDSHGLTDERLFAALIGKPIRYIRKRKEIYEWVSPDVS